MAKPNGSNIPQEELRWSLDAACREFGITSHTLHKRLVAVNERADLEDKCYSTEQIITAVFGSIQGERLREVREKADNLALKNASLRGELLDRMELAKALEPIFLAVRQIISASSLSKEMRDDLLNTIATFPLSVANVAVKQRKQLRAKDDDDGEEEADEAETEVEAEEVEYQV
jgi:hypothetical protein